jgi:hypothetical protein
VVGGVVICDNESNRKGEKMYLHINKQTIVDAWVFLRENNCTIPDETIDFMRDAALEKLKKLEESKEERK